VKRDHIRPPIHHHATSPQERTTPRRYLNCRGAVMAKQPKPQARPSHRAQPVENKGVSRKPCWMHSQSDFRGPGSPFRPPTFRRFSFSAPKTPALRHPITSNRDSLGFPRIRPFSLIPHPRPTIRFATNPHLTSTGWIYPDSAVLAHPIRSSLHHAPFATNARLTRTGWISLDLPGFGARHLSPSALLLPRPLRHEPTSYRNKLDLAGFT